MWYNASGKRCVDDVRDGRQDDVKVFMKRGGNGIEFTRLGGCAVDYFFKTDSSVTGSKVIKGFPAKEVSGKQFGLEDEMFSGGADFLGEVIRKDFRQVVRVKR